MCCKSMLDTNITATGSTRIPVGALVAVAFDIIVRIVGLDIMATIVNLHLALRFSIQLLRDIVTTR